MSEPGTGRMSDDDREDLAAIADAASRRNRPLWMVVGGALLLAIALIWLMLAVRSVGASERGARAAERRLEGVRQLAAEFEALQAVATSVGPSERGRPIPDLLSRIEAIAERSGMAATPAVPQRTNDAVPGGRRVRLRYNVNDPSLEAVLAWVDAASSEVPGLYPYSISITPGGQRWTMTVVFARFERL
ncbi:MAG: hypothetical protein AAFP26_09565 [Planctomycetota bacterium]